VNKNEIKEMSMRTRRHPCGPAGLCVAKLIISLRASAVQAEEAQNSDQRPLRR